MDIIFKDKNHENAFYHFIDKMQLPHSDPERTAFAYLLALNEDCRSHINDLYDFSERVIILEGLDKGWQTGTSLKTTRLAFNLFNGYCYDGHTYKGSDGYERDLPSGYYSPVNLFSCDLTVYFLEGIKLRFPEWF